MDNIWNTEHALTFADLRVHYYTGRSYLISGEGRDKVFGYRHGVMTAGNRMDPAGKTTDPAIR